MELEKGKTYRVINQKSKFISDILILNKGYKEPLKASWALDKEIVYNGLSFVINFTNNDDFFKFFKKETILHSEIETSDYQIIEEKESSAFIKLEKLYSLFEEAKQVLLIGLCTVFKSEINLNARNYFCDIVYLKIDNLFTEIIFSHNAEFTNELGMIEYVYIFQSDFWGDLSLNFFETKENCIIKYYNHDIPITVSQLDFKTIKEYFKPCVIIPDIDDVIGINLEDFIICSFKSDVNNTLYPTGIIKKH